MAVAEERSVAIMEEPTADLQVRGPLEMEDTMVALVAKPTSSHYQEDLLMAPLVVAAALEDPTVLEEHQVRQAFQQLPAELVKLALALITEQTIMAMEEKV